MWLFAVENETLVLQDLVLRLSVGLDPALNNGLIVRRIEVDSTLVELLHLKLRKAPVDHSQRHFQ